MSQLFARALLTNVVPIKVTAKEISAGTEEKRDRLIEERIGEQYGSSAVAHYRALDREQKLILVDDLDSLGMNADLYQRALSYIKRSFQHAVVTLGERFDVSLLGSTTVANVLAGTSQKSRFAHSSHKRSNVGRRQGHTLKNIQKQKRSKSPHSIDEFIPQAQQGGDGPSQ